MADKKEKKNGVKGHCKKRMLHWSLFTFHARIRVRRLATPARAAVVGHLLRRLVLDHIPVSLLVHQLDARAHLARVRGRLTGCADVLPGGSRVHLRCLHRHRDRTLLHANVSPVQQKEKSVRVQWISTFF